jgi:GT2 family glycosyltransferase
METPLVSVLLASRDGERHLEAALESLARQTWPAIEIVAVDDGSRDGTAAILERFAAAHGGMRIERAAGLGRGGARALASQLARGEFLAIQDDDDVSEPERLEREVRYLLAHPETVAVSSPARIVDERGAPLGRYEVPLGPAAIARRLRRAPPLVHGALMMRRSALEAAGGYRRAFRATEDYDLYLRLAGQGALANLPEPLYAMRRHARNRTPAARADELSFLALARSFAHERRATGRDSIAAFESAGSVERFFEVYPAAGRLAFHLGEAFVRDGRVREGRRWLRRALVRPGARREALGWWLLSFAVALTPRAARARAAGG